jgi:ArsR family transcriptional regulator
VAPLDIPPSVKRQLDRKGGMKSLRAGLKGEWELEDRAAVYRALADPGRLRILELLSKQPLCVCLIKEVVDMPDSKLSYHLSVLRDASLIEDSQDGNWRIYSLTGSGRKHSP